MHRRSGSARLSRSWLSARKATRISHERNPKGTIQLEREKKKGCLLFGVQDCGSPVSNTAMLHSSHSLWRRRQRVNCGILVIQNHKSTSVKWKDVHYRSAVRLTSILVLFSSIRSMYFLNTCTELYTLLKGFRPNYRVVPPHFACLWAFVASTTTAAKFT